MAFPTIPTVAAGRVLSVLATNPVGTHTSPNLSSLTKNAGDLLIAIVITYDGDSANAEFSSWGGGFTEFGDFATISTMGIGCAYKWSTGSETGTFTVTGVNASGTDSAFFLLSIPGAHDSTPPEAGSYATGTTAAADPASFNPSGWDAEDTLWIAVGASGESSTTGSYTGIASAPANFTDYADSGISADVVGGVEGAVAFRQLNAASLDVGTFSLDVSNARSAACVIAVRPAPTVHTATGAISVPSATVAGTGVMHPSGTGAISIPSATVAGTGAEVFTATGAISVPSVTVAGTGAEVFTATGAVTVSAGTVAGTGAEILTATGAISAPAATVDGTGDHTEAEVEPEGTGEITVPAPTVVGTGALVITGTGAISVSAAAVEGSGVEVFSATGTITVPSPAVVASGLHVENATGTGAIVLPAPSVAGSGLHIEPPIGSGAISGQAPLISGTGQHLLPVTGTGAIAVLAPLVSGSGDVEITDIPGFASVSSELIFGSESAASGVTSGSSVTLLGNATSTVELL